MTHASLLLCSQDPLFIKSLYGTLRDDGFEVETTDQTARAVQMSLNKHYSAVIMDADGVGLPAPDAARIIGDAARTQTILVGYDGPDGTLVIEKPLDVERVRTAIRSVCSEEIQPVKST